MMCWVCFPGVLVFLISHPGVDLDREPVCVCVSLKVWVFFSLYQQNISILSHVSLIISPSHSHLPSRIPNLAAAGWTNEAETDARPWEPVDLTTIVSGRNKTRSFWKLSGESTWFKCKQHLSVVRLNPALRLCVCFCARGIWVWGVCVCVCVRNQRIPPAAGLMMSAMLGNTNLMLLEFFCGFNKTCFTRAYETLYREISLAYMSATRRFSGLVQLKDSTS